MTKTEKFSRIIPRGNNKVKIKNRRFIKTTPLLCSYLIQLMVCLLFVVSRKGETLLPKDIASSSMHRNKCQFKSLSGVPNIQYSQENPQNFFKTKKKPPNTPPSTLFFMCALTRAHTHLCVWVCVHAYLLKHTHRSIRLENLHPVYLVISILDEFVSHNNVGSF